jgi:hypothetical protein
MQEIFTNPTVPQRRVWHDIGARLGIGMSMSICDAMDFTDSQAEGGEP